MTQSRFQTYNVKYCTPSRESAFLKSSPLQKLSSSEQAPFPLLLRPLRYNVSTRPRLNSTVNVNPITTALSASNARELLAPYDLILDCTDNLPTRYLLSDTAVCLGKPLVSGAAQKFEGQLAVYNLPLGGRLDATHMQERGPCFRCLFPKPPAPETVGSCEELGILGAVTGVIGNLQALEAIKLIVGLHGTSPNILEI